MINIKFLLNKENYNLKKNFLEPEPLVVLIKALTRLPGIGVRSARRIAYYMLQNDIHGLNILAKALDNASTNLCNCIKCNNFSTQKICEICSDTSRDSAILCIVETPSDLNILEASKSYNGLYYVLMGKLSPLEGIGPKELNFKSLIDRISNEIIKEVIIATSFTTEGETTAHFLNEILLSNELLKISRLSKGIPSGSELEYIDPSTIAWSIIERKTT